MVGGMQGSSRARAKRQRLMTPRVLDRRLSSQAICARSKGERQASEEQGRRESLRDFDRAVNQAGRVRERVKAQVDGLIIGSI
jgi:hypothetical protein